MAGHSKWANIKHRKGRQDAARGKLFAKLARAIEIEARKGGGDPDANYALAAAVSKAKAASMPNDNILRAIKRGTGESAGVAYDELWYEGYAPGGVAVYVQVLTDNRRRAAADVRAVFTRNGGSLGEPGSVGYLFQPKGLIAAAGDEDEVLLAALEAGAEDIRETGDSWEVITPPRAMAGVRTAMEDSGLAVESAELTQLPISEVPVDQRTAPRVLRLVDALEDLDDVQSVFSNFEISDRLLEALASR